MNDNVRGLTRSIFGLSFSVGSLATIVHQFNTLTINEIITLFITFVVSSLILFSGFTALNNTSKNEE